LLGSLGLLGLFVACCMAFSPPAPLLGNGRYVMG